MPRSAPTPARPPAYRRTIALAGATFLVIAALAFPRHPAATDPEDGAPVSRPESLEQQARVAPAPQPGVASTASNAASAAVATAVAPPAIAPPKKPLVPKAEKNRLAETAKSGTPIPAATTAADNSVEEDAATVVPESDAVAPPAPSTGSGGIAPVTITGCLEVSVNRDEFRLTDTEGVDAPRSRSWRTGFLKKRSAPVALVGPADELGLKTHVGRRVAATGQLTSRDLKISALRVVGASCN